MNDQSTARAISLWVDTAPGTSYPRVYDEVDVDFVVVGGGVAAVRWATIKTRAGADDAMARLCPH